MRVEYAKALIALAEYYNRPLTELQIAMYVEDLLVLSLEELNEAILIYRKNPRNTFFPIPSKLIECVRCSGDPESEATEAAARLIGAVSRYGYVNPREASEYIGEIGWSVVNRMGGWRNVCSLVNENNFGTLQSQFKQIALAQIRRAEYGFKDTPPSFRIEHKPENFSGLPDIVKNILPQIKQPE